MNGKDLSWVESFTENINGSKLATEDSVRVCRLWWTQKALVIALEKKEKPFNHNVFNNIMVQYQVFS